MPNRGQTQIFVNKSCVNFARNDKGDVLAATTNVCSSTRNFEVEGRWAGTVIYRDISPWLNLHPTHLCNLQLKNRGLINTVTHWSSEKVGHMNNLFCPNPVKLLPAKFTGRGYIKVGFEKTPLPRKNISTNQATSSAAFLLRLSSWWPTLIYISVQSSDSFRDRDNTKERG